MRPLLLFGPTGSGKTTLAISLARERGGEVVNADSRLLYRGMDIGTAKPTEEEQRGVPHHLMDIADPGEQVTAGVWRERALGKMEDIGHRGALPIVAGGTGFYMRILLSGWDLGGVPPSPALRAAWMAREEGEEGFLHRRLSTLSPERAGDLSATDHPRLLRALELAEAGAEAGVENPLDAATFYLNPPRDGVDGVLARRVDGMWEAGLAEEAEALWRAYPDSPVLARTIGYAEFRGGGGEGGIKAAIIANTLRLAKRQRTWGRSLRMETTLLGADPDENLRMALDSL